MPAHPAIQFSGPATTPDDAQPVAPRTDRSGDNSVLTPRVQTSEFDGFARRVIRAYGRRVASGDVEALPAMLRLEAELDAVIAAAVLELRNAHGYSWAEIASRLGTSRQAAQHRWGRTTTRCTTAQEA